MLFSTTALSQVQLSRHLPPNSLSSFVCTLPSPHCHSQMSRLRYPVACHCQRSLYSCCHLSIATRLEPTLHYSTLLESSIQLLWWCRFLCHASRRSPTIHYKYPHFRRRTPLLHAFCCSPNIRSTSQPLWVLLQPLDFSMVLWMSSSQCLVSCSPSNHLHTHCLMRRYRCLCLVWSEITIVTYAIIPSPFVFIAVWIISCGLTSVVTRWSAWLSVS